MVFKALNPKDSETINSEKIDVDQVPPEVLKVIEPLLLELEVFHESLDELEFVESCLALLKTKSIAERNTIMDFGKPTRPEQPRFTFTPVISKRSKELASAKLKNVS